MKYLEKNKFEKCNFRFFFNPLKDKHWMSFTREENQILQQLSLMFIHFILPEKSWVAKVAEKQNRSRKNYNCCFFGGWLRKKIRKKIVFTVFYKSDVLK